MKIISFKSLNMFKNIFLKDENEREINIYKCNDCTFTGINLYYPNVLINTNNQLILPLLEKTMSLKIGTIYEKNNMEFESINNVENNYYISDPLFFFIYNTDNYFHYIYDTLPYLISYLKLKEEIPKNILPEIDKVNPIITSEPL